MGAANGGCFLPVYEDEENPIRVKWRACITPSGTELGCA